MLYTYRTYKLEIPYLIFLLFVFISQSSRFIICYSASKTSINKIIEKTTTEKTVVNLIKY